MDVAQLFDHWKSSNLRVIDNNFIELIAEFLIFSTRLMEGRGWRKSIDHTQALCIGK